MESDLLEDIPGNFTLTINGKDYREIQGIEIKKGQTIKLESIIEIDKLGDAIYLNIYPRLVFKDLKGNTYEVFFNAAYYRNFSNKDLIKATRNAINRRSK